MNNFFKDTITLTFGEQAENHVGMQIIGNGLADSGFSLVDLQRINNRFSTSGYETELIDLTGGASDKPEAAILIIREGLKLLLGDDGPSNLYNEQINLNWDKKAKMKGRVVNKRSRYNLCYGVHGQTPDYENNKGRIVPFDHIPLTRELHGKLHEYFGDKARNLNVEGNLYYDKNTGIGFHGDSERKRVIAVRLGKTMNLVFRWFLNGKFTDNEFRFNINHGDIYVMSEKATGHDWKKRKIYTLRHAAAAASAAAGNRFT